MKIEYEKPWFVKPKLGEEQTNIIMNPSYTISLSFLVGKNFKRDDKIGFFGIPGKNFGLSYDYLTRLFVFEFWTKDSKGQPVFNCHTYDTISDELFTKKTNITLTYNGSEYKIFINFKLFDLILCDSLLVDDYANEPIYIGCHNIDSINQSHRNLTEIDVFHLSIFKKPIDIDEIKTFVTKSNRNIENLSDNLLCISKRDKKEKADFISSKKSENEKVGLGFDSKI
jgi:hypothetical protein